MDAFGVVYIPTILVAQQSAPKVSFLKHLDVLKNFYREAKWVGTNENKRLIPTLLDHFELEL